MSSPAPSGTNPKGLNGLASSGSVIADVATKVIPLLPPEHKLAGFLVAIAALLLVAIGAGLTASGEPLLVFLTMLAAFAFGAFYYLIYVFSLRSRARKTIPTWYYDFPQWPLTTDLVDGLHHELEGIQQAAFMRIKQVNPKSDVKPDEIRTNIFLPDYNQADLEAPFMLRIDKRLQVGMDDASDIDIAFKPGQGLTGQVFVGKSPKIARALKKTPAEPHEFDEVYELSKKQKNVVHDKLRWIVSFRLTVPGDSGPRPVGVLNVDGLRCELDEKLLNDLYGALLGKVERVKNRLAKAQTTRLALFVEAQPW